VPNVVGPDTLTPVPPRSPSTGLPFPEAAQTGSTLLAPGAGDYRLWRCRARTKGKSGWSLMAAAGDDSQQALPAARVKLHAGITRILVLYEAIRHGAWPELPDPRGPVVADPNLTLLSWHDEVEVTVSPGATEYVCFAKGRRLYGCTLPVYGWVNGLLVPAPPCCTAARGSLNVPPGKFTRGII
jgi:hypothetical protein